MSAGPLESVMIPEWLLVLLNLGNLVLYTSLIIRWPHVILSRWDVAMIVVLLLGWLVFDWFIISTGGEPSVALISISRSSRLIMLTSLGWIGHMAARRQEKMGVAENGRD